MSLGSYTSINMEAHHLRVLVRAGAMSERRRGRERWYALAPEVEGILEAARD